MVADFDGDGQDDLAVPQVMDLALQGPGRVLVFAGPVAAGTYGPDEADTIHALSTEHDSAGEQLVAAELDGVLGADLVVVAPTAAAEGYGAVHLLFGDRILGG